MDDAIELTRLERAMGAFLRLRAEGGDAGEFLHAHEDLRDLLEPMLLGDPETDANPDTLLGGDFRLERPIGAGGTGVVHAAWQVSLNRRVAVKVLPRSLMSHPATVARFRREAKTIATLSHPGIVRVLAVGSDGDTHWFAMDLVDGQSLEQKIDELGGRGESPTRWTRRMVLLAVQIADALHHAHGLGVVHRDVKPSNILVRPDGNAVLTDFGLARDAQDPSITQPGGRAGTPCYMAPEQITGGADEVDARSDVFALGATLFEMLTFTRAFDAPTAELAIARVLNDEPADPRRRNPGVSTDLAAVVAKAMDKDPARRYPSAGAFADDLRAYLVHGPVQARAPSSLTRLRRWARRRPAVAASAAGLAIGVPVVAALLGYIVARAPLVQAGEEKVLEDLIEQGFFHAAHSHRDHPKASRALDEALRLAPENPEVLVAYAMMLSRWDSHAAALAFLEARPAALAAHRELRRAQALYLQTLQRRDEAQAIERQLGEPRGALEFMLAGIAAFALPESDGGGPRRALHHLSLATRLSSRPRLGIVTAFADVADVAGDAAAREEAVAMLTLLWPESSRAWGMVAWVLRRADPPRALAAVDRALQLYPGEPGLLHFRGVILGNLGDTAGAIRELERALANGEIAAARADLERLRAIRQAAPR